MKKTTILKGLAITVLLLGAAFGTVTTWGLMIRIIRTQEQIIEQQNTLSYLLLNSIPVSDEGESLPLAIEVHCELWHYDEEGNLLDYSHHPGTLTNLGKNYTRIKLAGVDDASWGLNGTYIALSNSSSAPSAAWTSIPDEITTGSMGRASGSYTDNGVGAWNVTNTFSPTETNSTQLVGLYYNSGVTATLIASDTITLINYESGDSVEIRWSISVS